MSCKHHTHTHTQSLCSSSTAAANIWPSAHTKSTLQVVLPQFGVSDVGGVGERPADDELLLLLLLLTLAAAGGLQCHRRLNFPWLFAER